MASTYAELVRKNLIKQEYKFLDTAVQMEVILGSIAYGVSNDTSDMDIYGFAIAPKHIQFPQCRGEIPGFDDQGPMFEHYQKHNIHDKSALGGKGRIYDISIYSITKYFKLLLDNNPNIIDSLFVPQNCVLYTTSIGELVRKNRNIFIHKGCWAKFKGYAYSQMGKLQGMNPEGKRKKMIEEHGYDVKHAYHIVRLLNEVEQLLVEHDMNLMKNKEQLKSIRRGEWSFDQLEEYFITKERELEKIYLDSTLPLKPDKDKIKSLLIECMDKHYVNTSDVVSMPDKYKHAILEIEDIIKRVKHD